MSQIPTVSSSPKVYTPDPDYDVFERQVRDSFATALAMGGGQLFKTDVIGLFDAYLDALPEGPVRQHHTCHACRHFIDRFGGLVVVDDAGRLVPACWNFATSGVYADILKALSRAVRRSSIVSPFFSGEETLGCPQTGQWHHLHACLPTGSASLSRGVSETSDQAMARKREEFGMVKRAIDEFSPAIVGTALRVLESEQLQGCDPVLGPVRWLDSVHKQRASAAGPDLADNLTWRAVAAAPSGFCHPRTSMAKTFLEDIEAKLSFADISRRFREKMAPLQYRRPQAPPSEGNIDRANKLITELGLTPSLRRRLARVDEVRAIWMPKDRPAPDPASVAGPFDHLRPRSGVALPVDFTLPSIVMTWAKFSAGILPRADSIDVVLSRDLHPFGSMVTAVDPEAPPIIAWDRVEARNPVSWYTYAKGSPMDQWGLTPGKNRLVGICEKPCFWGDPGPSMDRFGRGIFMLIHGARDTNTAGGSGLFPTFLRPEIAEAERTIELYSNRTPMEQVDGPVAAGLLLDRDKPWDVVLSVMSSGVNQVYHVDRWD